MPFFTTHYRVQRSQHSSFSLNSKKKPLSPAKPDETEKLRRMEEELREKEKYKNLEQKMDLEINDRCTMPFFTTHCGVKRSQHSSFSLNSKKKPLNPAKPDETEKLRRMEEELMREREKCKNLEQKMEMEINGWVMARRYWMNEIEELKKLRSAECKMYQVCLREESSKMQREMEKLTKQLEAERKKWQKEKERMNQKFAKTLKQMKAANILKSSMEKPKMTLETQKERKMREEIEKEKNKLKETCNEHTLHWAEKLLDKDMKLEALRNEKSMRTGKVKQLKIFVLQTTL